LECPSLNNRTTVRFHGKFGGLIRLDGPPGFPNIPRRDTETVWG